MDREAWHATVHGVVESWSINKVECQRIDAFVIEVLEKTLKSPLKSKEIKPVNPKRNQP